MSTDNLPADSMRCPCCSGNVFADCCGRFLRGRNDGAVLTYAPTAEALMRSRFTAFALRDADYLLRTWDPETCPASLDLDPDQQWHLLEILETQSGGPFDDTGVVRFRAHFHSAKNRKVRESFTETSTFRRRGTHWVYRTAISID